MTKIVYNACFGGFSLSAKAVARAKELAPDDPNWAKVDSRYGFVDDVPRHDPTLVAVVEELGKSASGSCASLAITEVVSGTLYRIDEYDGNESVMTNDDYEWTRAP